MGKTRLEAFSDGVIAILITTKGKISPALYAVAIPIAFVNSRIAAAIYVAVALMWLIPDPRIEKHLREHA